MAKPRLPWPKLATSTWFTGREITTSKMTAELAAQEPPVRILLLCGPPGMGKTQCAKKFVSTNYKAAQP